MLNWFVEKYGECHEQGKRKTFDWTNLFSITFRYLCGGNQIRFYVIMESFLLPIFVGMKKVYGEKKMK